MSVNPGRHALIFDTETTGIPDFHQPSDSAGQPYLVELGMVLVTLPDLKVVDTFQTLIQPAGWELTDELTAIHGITTAMCAENGMPVKAALTQYWRWANFAHVHIAYNAQFDRRIMRIALLRNGATREHIESMEANRRLLDPCSVCTPIAALPPTDKMRRSGRWKYKTPKLKESFFALFGREMSDAHTALGDVMALHEIVRELVKRGKMTFDDEPRIVQSTEDKR